jgi:O-acetyl-ADP-ribose deacetylase (regulator of RNase III)
MLDRPTTPRIRIAHVHGDLLHQHDADTWVNPWNRNFVPRWLLLRHGVSGALKKITGPQPWRDLHRHGLLAVGQAITTSGGHLPQTLIHVAGLHATWRASQHSVQASTRNAIQAAWDNGSRTVAIPLIGAGTGGLTATQVTDWMTEALTAWTAHPGDPDVLEVRVVHYQPQH